MVRAFGSPMGDTGLQSFVGELLLNASHDSPRSRQAAIGMSQVGDVCDRKIAGLASGAMRVNFSDPLKALVGTSVHALIEKEIDRQYRGSQRWLVEHKVVYRGVPGSVDLFDTVLGRVIDWKTTTKSNISRIKSQGVGQQRVTQIQMYAAGLRDQGYRPKSVSLVFIPVDGTLDDVYAVTFPVDVTPADEAVERKDRLFSQWVGDILDFTPTPTSLCSWCPFFVPFGESGGKGYGCPGATAPVQDTESKEAA